MKSVLFFDSMLTPKIVTFIYWLLLLVSLVGGVATMFTGYGASAIFFGLLQIIGGALGARIWCELMIVIFKINGNLQALVDRK
ncbi:DUF4282 domain-containing protein [Vibrio kasasachensis]|uniref:DUF4282 domain-containing protein n=1 Tax=Vibrio kasasachensis TaxID=2910248 RepID=UPI003D119ED8